MSEVEAAVVACLAEMLWRFRLLDSSKPFQNSKSTFQLIICNVNVPFVRIEVELQLDIIKIILPAF